VKGFFHNKKFKKKKHPNIWGSLSNGKLSIGPGTRKEDNIKMMEKKKIGGVVNEAVNLKN
jgi:hypothetical protein